MAQSLLHQQFHAVRILIVSPDLMRCILSQCSILWTPQCVVHAYGARRTQQDRQQRVLSSAKKVNKVDRLSLTVQSATYVAQLLLHKSVVGARCWSLKSGKQYKLYCPCNVNMEEPVKQADQGVYSWHPD